jgi:hypothetical protein
VTTGTAARPWRRAATGVSIAILVVVLAAAAWICVRAVMAKGELDAARDQSASLEEAISQRDVAAATAAIDELGVHAARAAELTGDAVWQGAEFVPFAGANLAAVRVVAAELDAIVAHGLTPLVTGAEALSSGARTADGGIDLTGIAQIQTPIAHARGVLEDASARLGSLDRGSVVEPVRDAIAQLSDVVGQLEPVVAAIDDAATLLPPMLGADGPRTILVALQNNAELRTGGGITGSFVEFRAEEGRLTLTAQADSSQFASRETGILELPESTTVLYGDRIGRYVQNASMPADFGVTAQLASEWWRSYAGSVPDAVISVDPLVLQALLAAAGPIHVAGQDLSAENLVSSLLVDPYLSLDPAAQTSLFRETASAVFSQLTSSDADLASIAAALAEPVSQGRVSLWSSHPDEQEVIAETPLAGPAARQRLAGEDAFAVYLNDATGAKMDSLLDVDIHWGVARCREDGHRDVVVSVTLTNRAPADAGSVYPASMTGGGAYGTAPGVIATNVSVSAPQGAYFGGVSRDGEAVVSADAEDAGFPVAATRVDVAPGESATMDFRFLSADARELRPTILHTPLLTQPEIEEASIGCS